MTITSPWEVIRSKSKLLSVEPHHVNSMSSGSSLIKDVPLLNHLLNLPRDADAIPLPYGTFAIQSISPNHPLVLPWL